MQRQEDADHEVQGASTEVAHQVQRWRRRLVGAAQRVERAGECQEVDVVAGLLSQRAVLAPPGHAGVHEPWVPGHALDRADPESLGDTRAVRLDQDVGAFDRVEQRLPARRRLQIEAEVVAATREGIAG